MIALITTALSILAILLECWVQNSPQRKKEAEHEALQAGRKNIVDGDVPAVESRIDGLLSVQTSTTDSAAGSESAEDIERRISKL